MDVCDSLFGQIDESANVRRRCPESQKVRVWFCKHELVEHVVPP